MKRASPNDGPDSEGKGVNRYLVEVTPGRELLYRTAAAFREAMRSGEITVESRVFHRATSQWISITEHPEYRRFISERGPSPRRVALPAPPPLVDASPAPAAPAPPITQKAAEIYQRMASGLTELKRRLETAKPKRPMQLRPPRPTPSARPATPKSGAGREASKPAGTAAASTKAVVPASSNSAPAAPGSGPPLDLEPEESAPAPESPPAQGGPRERWTFYP